MSWMQTSLGRVNFSMVFEYRGFVIIVLGWMFMVQPNLRAMFLSELTNFVQSVDLPLRDMIRFAHETMAEYIFIGWKLLMLSYLKLNYRN